MTLVRENIITPETLEYRQLCPLLAAAYGKSEEEQWFLFFSFSTLPEKIREILVSLQTVDSIKKWALDGFFPATHLAAIAKIIGLVALDREVPITSVHSLLEKTGLSSEQAQKTEDTVANLIKPILEFRAQFATETNIEEMPPMSRPSELGPKTVASPNVPQRNIIDLRKPPPPQT